MGNYIGRGVDIGMFEKQVLTADSSTTTFTLTYAVGSANSLLVVYGGVIQEPAVAYSVSGGGQSIVFSEAPVTGTTTYIIYLGKQLTTPRAAGQETTKQTLTGDGTTTLFTLTDPPVVPAGIMVFVDGILQREGAGNNYVSGGSTINFNGAPDSGAEIDVYTLVKEKVSIDTVADGSITRAKMAATFPYWDAAGKVGIGTASPSYQLQVKSSNGVIASESTGDVSTTGTSFLSLHDANGQAAYLGYGGDGGGTMALWNRKNGPTLFATNNAERMRIDASGNMAIGTTGNLNYSAKLKVFAAANQQVAEFYGSGSNGESKLTFANDYSSVAVGSLTSNLVFYAGGATAERMRITAGGNVIINNGSTVLDTSLLTVSCTAGTGSTIPLALRVGVDSDGYGCVIFKNQSGTQGAINVNTNNISMSGIGGLTFKATQVASTDPNTLDDYEEGSWTPAFSGSGTSYTHAVQSGTYVKIGSLVTAQFYLRVTAYSGTNSNVDISGFPFSSANINAYHQSPGQMWSTTAPSAIGLIGNNTTSANLWKNDTSTTIFTASEIIGKYFVGSFTYRASA